jgi:hypothetical protein
MQTPPEIALRRVSDRETLQPFVRRKIAGLERVCRRMRSSRSAEIRAASLRLRQLGAAQPAAMVAEKPRSAPRLARRSTGAGFRATPLRIDPLPPARPRRLRQVGGPWLPSPGRAGRSGAADFNP